MFRSPIDSGYVVVDAAIRLGDADVAGSNPLPRRNVQRARVIRTDGASNVHIVRVGAKKASRHKRPETRRGRRSNKIRYGDCRRKYLFSLLRYSEFLE